MNPVCKTRCASGKIRNDVRQPEESLRRRSIGGHPDDDNNNYYIDGALLSQSLEISSKRRRAESADACCQWALLNVQVTTLLFPFTVQKYIYLSVGKVHAWVFSRFRNPPNSRHGLQDL